MTVELFKPFISKTDIWDYRGSIFNQKECVYGSLDQSQMQRKLDAFWAIFPTNTVAYRVATQ